VENTSDIKTFQLFHEKSSRTNILNFDNNEKPKLTGVSEKEKMQQLMTAPEDKAEIGIQIDRARIQDEIL